VTSALVVDDEAGIREAVAFALRRDGFEVDEVADGAEALAAAGQREYDIVILDLMMPRLPGIEVCRQLRERSAVPIIVLTARDAEADRIIGLETGADDYVTKPFSVAELTSRVRAILRRRRLDHEEQPGAVRRIGDLVLDLERHEARIGDAAAQLTRSEFRVLALLAEKPGRVYRRREIMEHLWESSYVGDQRACDIHVSNLRRKLERDPRHPERIVTVRGVGYKLVAV
jgi:two-component system response regulator RegX3